MQTSRRARETIKKREKVIVSYSEKLDAKEKDQTPDEFAFLKRSGKKCKLINYHLFSISHCILLI